MTDHLRASIVINNYNYERYIEQAIRSALAQTYAEVEVIVVDDGSTDGSREIIERYAASLQAVFKKNGGQTSAMNAGFGASSGDVVFFLDADDALIPSAVEQAMPHFGDDDVVKVHWPLRIITRTGRETGAVKPPAPPARGRLLEQLQREGPDSPTWCPTSWRPSSVWP